MLIRLAPADAAAYRALMLEAYRDHPDAFTSSVAEREALPLAWWEARMGDDPAARELVVGGFLDGQLVAAAGLSCETRERLRHRATLFGMVVRPGFRQGGLGRALVEAVLAHARQRAGLRQVLLTVTHGNTAAQRLYERCGFVAYGVEPRAVAFGDGFVDKVLMACRLDTAGVGEAAPAQPR